MVKVAPSILSADFSRLGDEIRRVERNADFFHLDVMDGHFVPNITFGTLVIGAVRSVTVKPIEAHLMVESPSHYVEGVARAGANIITVHIEADRNIHRTFSLIRGLGCTPAVALNPSTPLSAIDSALGDVGMVLVMAAEPGFAGQKFMDSMLPKVKALKESITRRKLKCEVGVDCGINRDTGKKAVAAGADILVSSSYIFGSRDPDAAMRSLKAL